MMRNSSRECGEPTGDGWAHTGDPTLCFECDYWTKQIEAGGGVVVDGKLYLVGPEARIGPDQHSRGPGGRRFGILTENGRCIIADSLRDQGLIPERFRARLPDDARFIDE